MISRPLITYEKIKTAEDLEVHRFMDALFGGSTSIASYRQSAGEPCMLTGSAVPRIYNGVLKSGKSPWRRYVCLGVVIGGLRGLLTSCVGFPLRLNHQVNRCGPGGDCLPRAAASCLNAIRLAAYIALGRVSAPSASLPHGEKGFHLRWRQSGQRLQDRRQLPRVENCTGIRTSAG